MHSYKSWINMNNNLWHWLSYRFIHPWSGFLNLPVKITSIFLPEQNWILPCIIWVMSFGDSLNTTISVMKNCNTQFKSFTCDDNGHFINVWCVLSSFTLAGWCFVSLNNNYVIISWHSLMYYHEKSNYFICTNE